MQKVLSSSLLVLFQKVTRPLIQKKKKKKQPVRFLTGVSCFTTLGWRGRVKARPGQSAVKCEELLASNIHFHLQFVFTK